MKTMMKLMDFIRFRYTVGMGRDVWDFKMKKVINSNERIGFGVL